MTHGWRTILNNFVDASDMCTLSDIFNIKMKYKYLSLALHIAIEDMPGSAALILDCFLGVTVLHAYPNKWIGAPCISEQVDWLTLYITGMICLTI